MALWKGEKKMNEEKVKGILTFLLFGWLPLNFLVVSEAGFFLGALFAAVYLCFLMGAKYILLDRPACKKAEESEK